MLTKLDRFIIKKFLGTFVFILILLMSISIVFDLSEKLNELLVNGAPWSEIIGIYYSNFFLYYGVQFSYLINFISVIWFTSKLAGNSEIIPILSAGVSFNRLLRPYMIASAILVAAVIIMYNFVLPESNKSRIAFEDKYYRAKISKVNQRMQISENEILFFSHFNAKTGEITKMKLERWNGDSLEYVLKAEYATGDSLVNDWTLNSYEVRRIGEFHDQVYYNSTVDTTLSFNLSDLVYKSNVVEAMNNAELNAFIEEQIKKGSDRVPNYLIEKHKRWASPFAIFVLTVIGLSVSSQKSRGGLGLNIAIGLSIAVLYIFAMQMTTVAALKIGFPPVIAVWLPNIIFSIIAIILYRLAPK